MALLASPGTCINAAIPAEYAVSMRSLIVLVWLAGAGGGIAVAEDVPLPRPRPSLWIGPQTFREAAGPDFNSADVTSASTGCDERLEKIAVIEPMPG